MQDSIWFRNLPKELRRILAEADELPETADVVIVGGGMIGLCIAYYLTEAGVTDICILDRGTVLAEASGANAGGLWFGQQSTELGSLASLAKHSRQLYDELSERFDIGFERKGLIELFYGKAKVSDAVKKVRDVKKAGFEAKKLTPKEVRSLEPSIGIDPKAAVFYPDEAQVHPALMGARLVEYLRETGVKIVLGTEIEELNTEMTTSRGPMEAGTLVVAAGAWTPLITKPLGWDPPVRPRRGTLLAVGPLPRTIAHTVIGANYYYWQLDDGYIAGGGSVDDVGFERGVDPETSQSIREEMNEIFPRLAIEPTATAWSGFRPYCDDLKPIIGPIPRKKKMFVATGHFKKGIMLAPVTGKITADLITKGRTNLPIAALSPERFVAARKASKKSKAKVG